MNPFDGVRIWDPYDLADFLGVDIGPRPAPLTADEIRAALDEVMGIEPCELCGGLPVLGITGGGTKASMSIVHDDDCSAA